uniref:Uncharacterized protein n=1 Tax=Anguilla anguilla TaxID=7936 RepID=A0A0E9WHL5_ANGAN
MARTLTERCNIGQLNTSVTGYVTGAKHSRYFVRYLEYLS